MSKIYLIIYLILWASNANSAIVKCIQKDGRISYIEIQEIEKMKKVVENCSGICVLAISNNLEKQTWNKIEGELNNVKGECKH